LRGRVWQAYYEAGPYISNLNWLKEIIRKNIGNVADLGEFQQRLKSEEKNLAETIKRNDLKIYLMYLEGKG